MRTHPFVMLLGLVLAAPAVAQEETSYRPAQGDQSTDNEMPATEGDGLALSMLLGIDEQEVLAADLARRKNPSQPVADFAKAQSDAHAANRTRSEEILRAIHAERVDLADLEAMQQANEEARERLEKLTGDAFETAWLDAHVASHAAALRLIDERLLPAAKNDDVIVHLRQTRGHAAAHLEQAKFLVENPDR